MNKNTYEDPYEDSNFGFKCNKCKRLVIVPEYGDPETHPKRLTKVDRYSLNCKGNTLSKDLLRM